MSVTSEGANHLELSTQLVMAEAVRRGAHVEVLDAKSSFIRVTKAGRTEYIKQATRTSIDTYIAPLIMEHKEITKLVLREHGINVPDGVVVYSEAEAAAEFEQFVGRDIVVKPNSTNFGIGVVILRQLADQDVFMQAVRAAFQEDDTVIIETFYLGREYRFLVIGDETVAVLYREPANVVGDGKRTIAELVAEKNKDPRRGSGYVTPLEQIKLGDVEREYLAGQGLKIDSVPAEGETIYLRKNSNISTGGDSIDCTDDVLDEYKQIAVQAAQAVGAKICGADIIIPDIRKRPEETDETGYCIIELNFNPALHIHSMPYAGKNREVEKKVLDLLGI